MDINIYKAYSFEFDKNAYYVNFKKALDENGKQTPAEFNRLLKEAGIKNCNYETVKSYFYGRRILPLDVFIAVYRNLKNCSADEILFPGSVQKPLCDKDIGNCEHLFRNIFYPYETLDYDKIDDLTGLLDVNAYESDVNALASILSRYNYLIQKYHYASVSNDELAQISDFSMKYIIERTKAYETDYEEVLKWARSYDGKDFLNAFYDKHTLGYFGTDCYSLLKSNKGIPEKLLKCALQLLPNQDWEAKI